MEKHWDLGSIPSSCLGDKGIGEEKVALSQEKGQIYPPQ